MNDGVWCTEYLVLFTWDEQVPVERWQIKSVGPHTQTTIRVINSTSDYFVRVQARNKHGFGPKSDVVRFQPNKPSQPSADTPPNGRVVYAQLAVT